MKKWQAIASLTAILLFGSAAALPATHASAQSAAVQAAPVLREGASSGDVWDLQYRLNVLGYYTEPLDGLYGPGTAAAVMHFQQNYGLGADGITGAQTWHALKTWTVDQSEMDVLAHIIYGEARGESYEGQVAVGAVIMNRTRSGSFPTDVKDVVFQPGAFTAVDDGQYYLTPNAEAYQAAYDAVRGWDPSHGALFYFNPDTATSSWIWSRPQTVTIGHHIFAK